MMDNLPPELLLIIASVNQFIWRPLSCVNKHMYEILSQRYDMYDYISGPVFICYDSQKLTFDDEDNVVYTKNMFAPLTTFKRTFDEGLHVGLGSYSGWIIYYWERVREYAKIHPVGRDRWIANKDLTHHFELMIYLYDDTPYIYYYADDDYDNEHYIKCKSIETLRTIRQKQKYFASFYHLLRYIPNLEYVRYIIGSRYIPHHL